MAKQDRLKAIRAGIVAAQKLRETEQELRERHAALSKERQILAGADPAMAEVLASMEGLVDRKAAEWAKTFSGHIVRAVGGHEAPGVAQPTRMKPQLPQLPRFGDGRTGLTIEDLCGLDPERVKTQFAGIIRESGARFGLPVGERAAKLAELDAAIISTVAAHTELVDASAEVGITLALLAHVATKREREQQLQEREAELEDARRKAAARGEPLGVVPAYAIGTGVGPA